MAYTLLLAPSLRTMQHVLGGRSQTEIASQQQGAEIQVQALVAAKLEASVLPDSELSRLLLRRSD